MKGKSKKAMLFISLALILSTALFGTLAYLTSEAKVTNTFTVGNVSLDLDEADVNENGEPLKDGKPVDASGNPITEDNADRTKDGNEYKLIPNKQYVKDPTVTVGKDSEPSYVRMMVTFDYARELDTIFDEVNANLEDNEKIKLEDFFVGHNANAWEYEAVTRAPKVDANGDTVKYEDGTEMECITYEFRYIGEKSVDGKVSGLGADEKGVKLEPLFTHIKVPGLINGDQMASIADMEMTVIAQGIQAEGFEADAANSKTAADVAWDAFELQMRVNAPADSDTTDSDDDDSSNADSGNTGNTGSGSDTTGGTPAGGSSDGDE